MSPTPPHGAVPCVRLFNVKFSPNLGDGLLAECLESGLARHGLNGCRTYSVDLAGRVGHGPGRASRGWLLHALSRLPAGVRRAALAPLLARWRRRVWAPHYRRHLDSADAVVIGGGNLLTDIDLNFPTKLAALLDECSARDLPVMIFGVGVTRCWSAKGRRLLAEALARADVVRVEVRDAPSLENFSALFGDAVRCTPSVVRDPGLMASRFKPFAPTTGGGEIVGVCVTAALAVRYHSDVSVSDEALLHWYVDLLDALARAGRRARVFTNGSPEDVQFAHRLIATGLVQAGPEFVPRPTDPDALVRLIGGCTGIVAFRMHAIVAAVSCGVGAVALRWDPKLDAFMASVGLADFVLSVERTDPERVVDVLSRSVRRVREDLDTEALVDDALEDVRGLSRALRAARRPPRSATPVGASLPRADADRSELA